MNKKQKVLTFMALVMFLVIGGLYLDRTGERCRRARSWERGNRFGEVCDGAIVKDPMVPWVMLGVSYTALFFLLQNKRGS